MSRRGILRPLLFAQSNFELTKRDYARARQRGARLKLVILKRGGEPGNVAINPERVTHVRASSGPFTDVHFGDFRIAVEGSFHQVVAMLSGVEDPAAAPAAKTWLR